MLRDTVKTIRRLENGSWFPTPEYPGVDDQPATRPVTAAGVNLGFQLDPLEPAALPPERADRPSVDADRGELIAPCRRPPSEREAEDEHFHEFIQLRGRSQ